MPWSSCDTQPEISCPRVSGVASCRWVRPILTMSLNAADFAASASRRRLSAGTRRSCSAWTAATFIAVGKTSLEDCPRLTSSLGCTRRFSPRSPPRSSLARLASTSFMFMLVCVPEPVCQTTSGNSPSCFPASTSSAAAMMAFALSAGRSPSSRLTTAQARLTLASAWMTSGAMRSPEMRKFSSDRCVCAPHNRSAGTRISPKLSRSMRVSAMVAPIEATCYAKIRLRLHARALVMKIDIFNHVMPVPYLDMMKQHLKDPGILKRMSNLRMLWDIEARVQMLEEKFPDVQQVLTLSLPSPELVGGPELAPELARIANDGMAGMVAKGPKKLPAFVASLPMNNVPAALDEMDRAIAKLGARGVQICSSVNGRPLDEPEFFPVFERATKKHDVPIWMHPARPATRADYVNEQKSKYEIWQVLGWPYETSVAMARMVFSGFFEKLPGLRIITHHCGGMIPYFAGRAETLWAQLGSRTADENYEEVLKRMSKKPIEYFRMFYGDTVLGGSASALRCGLDFFGADRVVFASDCPFDPEGGPMFIREGIRSVEDLKLPEADKRKIYFGNAIKLLRIPLEEKK